MSYRDPESILPNIEWTDFSLPGSIVPHSNALYGTARYCRIDGIVYVNIMVDNASGAGVVATLPVGCRPSQQLLFTGFTYGGVHTRMDVMTYGDLYVYSASPSWLAFTERFPADA